MKQARDFQAQRDAIKSLSESRQRLSEGGPGSTRWGDRVPGQAGMENPGFNPGASDRAKAAKAHKAGFVQPKDKRKINSFLHDMGKTYHDGIPVDKIAGKLKAHGLDFEDEGFILTGRDGEDNFPLVKDGKSVKNASLRMAWHKMPSGRYEITAYVS